MIKGEEVTKAFWRDAAYEEDCRGAAVEAQLGRYGVEPAAVEDEGVPEMFRTGRNGVEGDPGADLGGVTSSSFSPLIFLFPPAFSLTWGLSPLTFLLFPFPPLVFLVFPLGPLEECGPREEVP